MISLIAFTSTFATKGFYAPIAEDKAIARETSSGQNDGNKREHGQFSLAPQAAPSKLTDLTGKATLV